MSLIIFCFLCTLLLAFAIEPGWTASRHYSDIPPPPPYTHLRHCKGSHAKQVPCTPHYPQCPKKCSHGHIRDCNGNDRVNPFRYCDFYRELHYCQCDTENGYIYDLKHGSCITETECEK